MLKPCAHPWSQHHELYPEALGPEWLRQQPHWQVPVAETISWTHQSCVGTLKTYLWWDVRVKVPCILRITKFRAIGSSVTVNIEPINPPEERVCLVRAMTLFEHCLTEIKHMWYLDEVCTIYIARTRWGNESASSSLDNHGVGSWYGGWGLWAQTVFWFTKKLLHQVDSFMGYTRTGRESQWLFPVQNLLPSDMALLKYGK